MHDQRRFPRSRSEPKRPNAGQATFDLGLRMGGLVLAILLVALFMFIVKPKSFNLDVGVSVLRAMSSVAIMSLGLTLVIVVGEIDLSFGAMYGLGANSLAVMWIVLRHPDLRRAAAGDRASARWLDCSTAFSSRGCAFLRSSSRSAATT
jgi:ribose/xylose/arabinose/galactoside ABC-type transport system permease subunit